MLQFDQITKTFGANTIVDAGIGERINLNNALTLLSATQRVHIFTPEFWAC